MNTLAMIETGFPALPGMPGDFADHPRSLGEAVQLAVDSVADAALTPPDPEAVSPASQARALLALLVECYVRQIYSSRNAAARAARDPDFPWLWWEDFPDTDTLHRFRMNNLAVIHSCLVAVLRYLAEQKILAGTVTKIHLPQIAEEAHRRITMAAFADSTELDRA